MRYTLLIKGGTVIDPSQGLNGIFDVALRDGKIVKVEPSIEKHRAEEVFDATDLIVAPGLIDLHVHAFWGGSTYGIEPDVSNLSKGVTTALDAGSAGAWNFPSFRSHIINKSETSIYALLNISTMGMVLTNNGELQDLRWADLKHTVEAGLANKDCVLGIKARLGRVQAGKNDKDALNIAIDAATAMNGFVMIHIGNSNTPLPQLMDMLRPGDVVTHSFHGFGDGILDPTGYVLASMKEAQSRGVVIDVGHGGGGFSFAAADHALSEGLIPTTISSDIHVHNVTGPVFDLVTTMSKFMHLGMSLNDVIKKCTESPAKTMGLEQKIGSLQVGSDGDLTILKLEEGKFLLRDRLSTATSLGPSTWEPGMSVTANSRLTHVITVKNGEIYRPWSPQAC